MRRWLALSVLLSASLLPVHGQAPAGAAPARTPDGHPDLQGVYDVATLTPLERAANQPLVATDEEAARLEKQVADRKFRGGLPSRGDREAPPAGGDGSTGAAGNVGGYNNFWIDNGTRYVTVDGRKRMSLIIDPPDGRVPPLTADARQRAGRGAAARTTSDQQAREDDPGFDPTPGAYDDPERRPLGERCLLGFGSTSGPPALPVLYNNLHQIVQTPGYVIIMNEMVHDARIVRMNAPHLPPRSANGWAIPWADGTTTRSSSTRPISPTRRGSAAPRRACTSSSGSRVSTRKPSVTGSRSRIRRRGRRRGPASTRGRRQTSTSTSTPATRPITRSATSFAAHVSRKLEARSKSARPTAALKKPLAVFQRRTRDDYI